MDSINGTVYQESPWFSSLKISDCRDTYSNMSSDIQKHVYTIVILNRGVPLGMSLWI